MKEKIRVIYVKKIKGKVLYIKGVETLVGCVRFL